MRAPGGYQHEFAAYVDRAAYVSWDECGSFGFDVVRRTAADLNAASALGGDDAVSPGAGRLSRFAVPDAGGQAATRGEGKDPAVPTVHYGLC